MSKERGGQQPVERVTSIADAQRVVTQLAQSRKLPSLETIEQFGINDLLSSVCFVLPRSMGDRSTRNLLRIAQSIVAGKEIFSFHSPTILSDYLTVVTNEAVRPFALLRLGGSISPCFPQSQMARKDLVETWQVRTREYRGHPIEHHPNIFEMQLNMVGKGEVVDPTSEQLLAYVQRLRLVSSQYDPRFPEDPHKEALAQLVQQGKRLGLSTSLLSMLTGLSQGSAFL